MSMDVLHVIPAVAPRYGGPSEAIVGMGRALTEQGVRVLVATTDADGPDRLPVPLGAPVDWQGVPAIVFRRQFSEAFKYSRPFAAWLGEHVGEFRVVHIHAVFSHSSLAAARACQHRGVPYVVRPLGSLDPWSLRQKSLRKQVLWQFGAKQMLTQAAAVQYTTLAEQRLAEIPLGLQRGVVIPNGIDLSAYTPQRQDHAATDQPYVLVLGRVHPKKGLDAFIKVFVEVTRDLPTNWRLVIAGDGDPAYLNSLHVLARSLGADNRVCFVGWVGGEAKLAALQEASLLALPSYQENFGIVVVEALACGVPVLISEHVNLADDVLAANVGWVTSLEPQTMRETLSEALRSEGERHRRGAAGRTLAARFHWSAVSAELTRLYERVA